MGNYMENFDRGVDYMAQANAFYDEHQFDKALLSYKLSAKELMEALKIASNEKAFGRIEEIQNLQAAEEDDFTRIINQECIKELHKMIDDYRAKITLEGNP